MGDEALSPACMKCEAVTGKSTCFPGPCVFHAERNKFGTKAYKIALLARIRRGIREPVYAATELDKAHRLAGTMLSAQHEQERKLVLLEAMNSELLAELERAVEIIEAHVPEDALGWNSGTSTGEAAPTLYEVLHYMRAAIAKAQGQTHSPSMDGGGK